MSDQNLPDLNESNQMINAQPETASDQIAPNDATINGNLFVTGKVRIGTGTNKPDDVRSMLHIGDGLGAGYRPWMERGTLVSEHTDNVFFGLKNEGPDRKDAVIAWGDNPIDAFRFVFTEVGGPDNGQEIMRLQPNGNVGIGTTNPQYARLTLEHWSVPLAFRESDRAVTEGGLWRMPLDGGNLRFDVNTSASGNFSPYITALIMFPNGNVHVGGNLTQGSSRELKENIAELSGKEAIEALENLNPVKFNYKADSDKNLHIGFIAEDVPELVATSDRKALSPMDIVAVLTQALKEQQNTISTLAEKVKLLEAKTA
jgi:hypothetical protein